MKHMLVQEGNLRNANLTSVFVARQRQNTSMESLRTHPRSTVLWETTDDVISAG